MRRRKRATDLHRLSFEFNKLRAVDLIALILGYVLILAAATAVITALYDWWVGHPNYLVDFIKSLPFPTVKGRI